MYYINRDLFSCAIYDLGDILELLKQEGRMSSIHIYKGYAGNKTRYRAQTVVNGKRIAKIFTNKTKAQKWLNHLDKTLDDVAGPIVITRKLFFLIKNFFDRYDADEIMAEDDATILLKEMAKFNFEAANE